MDYTKEILRTISDPISFINKDYIYVFVNESFSKYLNSSPEKIIGKSVAELSGERLFNEKIKHHIDKCLQGQEVEYKIRVGLAGSEAKWLKITYYPHYNQLGEVDGLISTEKTILKKNELRNLNDNYPALNQELSENNENYERLNKKLKSLNSKLKKQKASAELNNKRLESLLKVSQYSTKSIRELIDFALHEAIELTSSKIGYIYFYNEERRQFSLNTWSKEVMKECAVMDPQTIYNLDDTGCWGEVVRQRKPIIINNYQTDNPHKKGTPKGHVKLKKFMSIPVFSDNKIIAVAGVANKKKDYDDMDVRQLSLLLDNTMKIVERVNLIKDLDMSRKKAEDSNRLKTEFLNNMSHEIRTPMNGIMGFARLLDKPGLTDEKRKSYQKIIINSSNQLLKIIDDILEISRLETKQVQLYKEPFSLNEFLIEIYSIFNLKYKETDVPIYLKDGLSDHDSKILSDKTKLHKIISNLLENAIKFTLKGHIELGYYKKEEMLHIYVEDTGLGISDENKKSIFNRFSQEEIEISRKHGGLGLGLSISKENAIILGGDILLESEKGKGSRFTLIIPYEPALKESQANS